MTDAFIDNITEQSSIQTETLKSVREKQAFDSNLDQLLDIDINLSIELGTKKMQIKDVLNLGENALLELDKSANSPLDIFANGNLIARGEIVVINNNFGIRITEIVKKSNSSSKYV